MPTPEEAANAFVDEQVILHLPFCDNGRFDLSESAFRAVLKVAFCMGAVHAITAFSSRASSSVNAAIADAISEGVQ